VRERTWRYARCKKSAVPKVQLLEPGYVFGTRCVSCGATLDAKSDFDSHFEIFEVRDKWTAGMFDRHIQAIEANPDKFKVRR